MQLDFALAYDELSPSIVQLCFGSSSRYHGLGWDEKKKVISLSNHVIFVLFMPRCWENIWKKYIHEKKWPTQGNFVLFFHLVLGISQWLVSAKIKNTTSDGRYYFVLWALHWIKQDIYFISFNKHSHGICTVFLLVFFFQKCIGPTLLTEIFIQSDISAKLIEGLYVSTAKIIMTHCIHRNSKVLFYYYYFKHYLAAFLHPIVFICCLPLAHTLARLRVKETNGPSCQPHHRVPERN